MACTDGSCSTGTGITCGTGGWNGPKPGDPDNNSVLSATPAFGGIDVTWTYPATNPHAVSHINVFRGNSSNPDLAVRRGTVTGTFYYDKIPSSEIMEYFYWIQIVSTNGTYGEWIGPVSAVPKESTSEVIQELTGRINEGVLAESLRDKIGEINLLKTSLNDEINSRLTGNAAIAEALSAVQSETAQAITYINQEITQRTTADEALLNSVNVLAVGVGDNTAAIANESLARATDMSAVASQINTVQTTLNGQIVGVETTMGAAIQDLEQTTDALGALYTVKLNANGLAGGFGVYNDGSTVQAGFDVDTFWIGRSAMDQLKPFVIEGDQVFLSNTVVPTIESNNYEPGVSGWKIRKEGPAEFQDIIIRGTGTFGGSLDAAGGTFTGALSAATGTFNGQLLAGVMDMSSFAGESHIFDTPGTYTLTVPSGKPSMRVTLLGGAGGGGGGGDFSSNAGGGGGGGGGAGTYTSATYTLTAGDTVTITIGVGAAGGSGGAGGNGGTGGNGQASVVSAPGVYLSASGGTGGGGGGIGGHSSGLGVDHEGAGGAGGSVGGTGGGRGIKEIYGDGLVMLQSSAGGVGGQGGASAYGSKGSGGVGGTTYAYPASGTSGSTGSGGGGGGGAAHSNQNGAAGGSGGNGFAVIEFFNTNSVVLMTTFQDFLVKYNALANAVGRSDLGFIS